MNREVERERENGKSKKRPLTEMCFALAKDRKIYSRDFNFDFIFFDTVETIIIRNLGSKC